MLAIAQADLMEHGSSSFSPACRVYAGVNERKFDIRECRCSWQQVVRLETKADAPVAKISKRFRRQPRDVDSIEEVAAGRGRIETSELVHQRRLARADAPMIATSSPRLIEIEMSVSAGTC